MSASPLTLEADRLVEYFLIVGADEGALAAAAAAPPPPPPPPPPHSDDDNGEPPPSQQQQPHQQPELAPRLLDRFPRRDHAGASLQPGLVHMCFPDGLRLVRAQRGAAPLPTFSTFVSTDVSGDRAFGHVLTIWDELEVSGSQLRSPPPTTTPPTPGEGGGDAATAASSSSPESLRRAVLFAPRALVFCSRWNLPCFRIFLRELYRLSLTPALPVPLERHVQNLVCEVPLPPAGRVSVACGVGGRARVLLQRAPRNRRVSAVNLSGSLRQLFECLDPQRVVLVWRCLLAERPVLLVSSQLSLLGACAEALVSLLYPLK
jgi:hypothetical protein